MSEIRWDVSVLISRWRNRLRYITKIPSTYRNWWAILLPKFGVSIVLELRNGLRYLVRRGTTDLGVLNEATMLDPYLGLGGIRVSEDSVIVDVGANIGDFTMQAAQACPRGRVIAVEPVSEHIRIITVQMLLNGFSNVTCVHAALGNQEGTIQMRGKGGFSSTYWGGQVAETVRLTTLPQIMHELAVDQIDLLKLDCEGAEWDILPAADDVLPKVRQICMEFHSANGWTPERLATWLCGRGFNVVHTTGSSWNGLLWATRPHSQPVVENGARTSNAVSVRIWQKRPDTVRILPPAILKAC